MARNYYDSVSAVTFVGQAVTRPDGAGYDVDDDIQTQQDPATKFDECVSCGDRKRSFDVDTKKGFADLFDGFIATTAAACAFTIEGIKCTDGSTETRTLALGNALGDSFEFSADGRSAATATAKAVFIGDPTEHL